MEPIIVLVGFLGAGKTTVLKHLIKKLLKESWDPFVILNDYENAAVDSQQFLSFLEPNQIQALSGSCICCSGINELRLQVNSIPKRKKGITLIEANGTTDAMALMEFLGVGLNKNFLPPVQISVVDCRKWQQRNYYNDIELSQVLVSSLVFLNHLEDLSVKDLDKVKKSISELNRSALFKSWCDFELSDLINLSPAKKHTYRLDHKRTHWASSSASLPDPLSSNALQKIIASLPNEILRVKGCTKLDKDTHYTHFEKTPKDLDLKIRPYWGKLVSGPVILTVGPGSDPIVLKKVVSKSIL